MVIVIIIIIIMGGSGSSSSIRSKMHSYKQEDNENSYNRHLCIWLELPTEQNVEVWN